MPEGERCNPSWTPFDFKIFRAKAFKIGSKKAAAGLHAIVMEWKELKGEKFIDKILKEKEKEDEKNNKQLCE